MTLVMFLILDELSIDQSNIQRFRTTDNATRVRDVVHNNNNNTHNENLVAATGDRDIASLEVIFPPPDNENSTVLSTTKTATTTPYKAPTPSFLLYLAHSGYSNQVNALQRAAQLAYKLNRTLVVPPVLPHTTDEVKLFPNWKPDTVGQWCHAAKHYATHQIKAMMQADRASRSATDKNSRWSKFPSFANIIDFSVLTEITGLKTLDLDEFMQHKSKGRLGHAAAKGFSKSSFSSYNTSVHTWCNANVNLNVTYHHNSVRNCNVDRDLADNYSTLLTYIQRQLDQQHQQVERWEDGYYRHDCRVLNVGSAFLLRNKFHSDPAAPLFNAFFNNYPLVEPWTSILKTLLADVGENFLGVHVRVLDRHKACTDSENLYQVAAGDVWALYNNNHAINNNATTISQKNSSNNIQYYDDSKKKNVLLIVGRVNGNSKLCLQQALQKEAAGAGGKKNSTNISSTTDMLQVVTVNDLIDSHDNKKQLQEWISSIEMEVSTIYLLLDQFLLALSEHLVMHSAYPNNASTFQQEIAKRHAYRRENLINLGF
jgi:hypothetical protein